MAVLSAWLACAAIAFTTFFNWPVRVFGQELRWILCILAFEFAIAGLIVADAQLRITQLVGRLAKLAALPVGCLLALLFVVFLPFSMLVAFLLVAEVVDNADLILLRITGNDAQRWELETWTEGATEFVVYQRIAPHIRTGAWGGPDLPWESIEVARRLKIAAGNGVEIRLATMENRAGLDQVYIEAVADGHRITIERDGHEVGSIMVRRP